MSSRELKGALALGPCQVQTAKARFGEAGKTAVRDRERELLGLAPVGQEIPSQWPTQLRDDEDDEHGYLADSIYRLVPDAQRYRNNLTALAQSCNLYFVAYQGDIFVFRPRSAPEHLLPTHAEVRLHSKPTEAAEREGGTLDARRPHTINHLITGFLGEDEIIVVCFDDGDILAYRVSEINDEICRKDDLSGHGSTSRGRSSHPVVLPNEAKPQQRDLSLHAWDNSKPRSKPVKQPYSECSPILRENVCISAWGLAVHAKSRLIAVSTNRHEVVVFAFAMSGSRTKTNDPCEGCGGGVEAQVRSRARTWRIVIALGPRADNLPNVAFIEDVNGEAEKICATDVDGQFWIANIWSPCKPVTLLTSLIRRNRPVLGWGVIPLAAEDFMVVNDIKSLLGGDPRSLVGDQLPKMFDTGPFLASVPDNPCAIPTAGPSHSFNWYYSSQSGQGVEMSSFLDFSDVPYSQPDNPVMPPLTQVSPADGVYVFGPEDSGEESEEEDDDGDYDDDDDDEEDDDEGHDGANDEVDGSNNDPEDGDEHSSRIEGDSSDEDDDVMSHGGAEHQSGVPLHIESEAQPQATSHPSYPGMHIESWNLETPNDHEGPEADLPPATQAPEAAGLPGPGSTGVDSQSFSDDAPIDLEGFSSTGFVSEISPFQVGLPFGGEPPPNVVTLVNQAMHSPSWFNMIFANEWAEHGIAPGQYGHLPAGTETSLPPSFGMNGLNPASGDALMVTSSVIPPDDSHQEDGTIPSDTSSDDWGEDSHGAVPSPPPAPLLASAVPSLLPSFVSLPAIFQSTLAPPELVALTNPHGEGHPIDNNSYAVLSPSELVFLPGSGLSSGNTNQSQYNSTAGEARSSCCSSPYISLREETFLLPMTYTPHRGGIQDQLLHNNFEKFSDVVETSSLSPGLSERYKFLITYSNDVTLLGTQGRGVDKAVADDSEIACTQILDTGQSSPELRRLFYATDRLSMLAQIPELNLLVVGSAVGYVVLITPTKMAEPLPTADDRYWDHGFRVEAVLPRDSDERLYRETKRPLHGLAVGPVAYGSSGPRTKRFRIVLHYRNHDIFTYEVGRASQSQRICIF